MQLADGQLDARATVVLGQLLATGPVSIDVLKPLPGESGLSFRRLVVTKSVGKPGARLGAWLKTVGSTYAPSTVTRTGDSTTILFPAIESDGLLG